MTELDDVAARVGRLAQKVRDAATKAGTTGSKDLPSQDICQDIALRVLTILHGKVSSVREPRSSLNEDRPYHYNECGGATDPEPAVEISASPTINRIRVWVDLGLRLQHEVKGSDHSSRESIVVSCTAEFSADPSHHDSLAVLWRNGPACLTAHILYYAEFRDALVKEFDLTPHLERLAEEFSVERERAWAVALPIAQKHAQRTKKARERKEKPEFKKKRGAELRTKAQISISNKLIDGELSSAYRSFTPEEFFSMYQTVASNFTAMQEIASWRTKNRAASEELTLEDVKAAYELAEVKKVMDS